MPESACSWYRRERDGAFCLVLHIQPGARQTEVAGLHGAALKIRLAAPPVDGKANAALLAFLAERLAVPRRALTLVSGDAARQKRVRIEAVSAADLDRLVAGR